MNIKYMLTLPFILSTVVAASELDSTKSIPFTLDSKTFFEKPPFPGNITYFLEKIDKGEYEFDPLQDKEVQIRIDANNGRPCLYCPAINSLILNSDSKMDCKNLHIRFLSEHVNDLTEENLELKKQIAALVKKRT